MVVLQINHWNSRCLGCNQDCDPNELFHNSVLGFNSKGKKGCGEKFTHVTSAYLNEEHLVKQMRPDLEYVDIFTATNQNRKPIDDSEVCY